MLETPHVFVGAAIATQIPNPWIAIPLAFASHFVLEMVPHWNPHLNFETKKYGYPTQKSTALVIFDSTTALVCGSAIAYGALPNVNHAATILFACLASITPDLIEAPYFFLRARSKKIERWISFQKFLQSDAGPIPGLFTQFITVLAAIFWISH